jgi:hypothetical protein
VWDGTVDARHDADAVDPHSARIRLGEGPRYNSEGHCCYGEIPDAVDFFAFSGVWTALRGADMVNQIRVQTPESRV